MSNIFVKLKRAKVIDGIIHEAEKIVEVVERDALMLFNMGDAEPATDEDAQAAGVAKAATASTAQVDAKASSGDASVAAASTTGDAKK